MSGAIADGTGAYIIVDRPDDRHAVLSRAWVAMFAAETIAAHSSVAGIERERQDRIEPSSQRSVRSGDLRGAMQGASCHASQCPTEKDGLANQDEQDDDASQYVAHDFDPATQPAMCG